MSDLNIMGHPVSKPVLFVGAGVTVVGGVIYWRKRSQSKAAAAAAATPSTSATAGTSTAVQQSALASTSAEGYGSYDPPYEFGTSLYPGTGITGNNPTISTNAEWSQAAAQYLENQGGMTANSVLDALGNGLTGAYVSPSQVEIWDAAVAFEGEPPQGSPPLNTTAPKGAGNPGFQTYAPGGKSLAQLASTDGVTYAALVKENPGVAKKYGNKPLPKGTGYYVPAGGTK